MVSLGAAHLRIGSARKQEFNQLTIARITGGQDRVIPMSVCQVHICHVFNQKSRQGKITSFCGNDKDRFATIAWAIPAPMSTCVRIDAESQAPARGFEIALECRVNEGLVCGPEKKNASDNPWNTNETATPRTTNQRSLPTISEADATRMESSMPPGTTYTMTKTYPPKELACSFRTARLICSVSNASKTATIASPNPHVAREFVGIGIESGLSVGIDMPCRSVSKYIKSAANP